MRSFKFSWEIQFSNGTEDCLIIVDQYGVKILHSAIKNNQFSLHSNDANFHIVTATIFQACPLYFCHLFHSIVYNQKKFNRFELNYLRE